eukprot:TRINITY_DN68_c2_g1_i1.p1 TRINITY_DN68_c2_g1~~TRINITY_DN68_c2_g1_i1.p1  ORF type:complete len:773 (+),score=140.74 TRINITY_DN68_c2_g1_i1:74-2392(+)
MNLPPLPSVDTCRSELLSSFRGPTKRSNWVVPTLLLCGDRSSLDSDAGMNSILDAGLTTIVCLQTRQETVTAVDYKKRAAAKKSGTKFVEQPIPDQEITDDAVIGELITQLLERLNQGEVLYIHCRGGHGRTGTVCALLLGRLYSLSAPEAMARIQLYHDMRQQPIFAAEGYEETADGSSCVVMFPSQRGQVLRLLAGNVPIELSRARSSVYGAGASQYSEESMVEWQALAKAASDALNACKPRRGSDDVAPRSERLQEAAELFWKAARLRPDFARGYIGMSRAFRQLGELDEARDALMQGLERCPEDGSLLQELKKVEEAAAAAFAPASSSGDAPAGTISSDHDGGGAQANAEQPVAQAQARAPPEWKPRTGNPRFVMLVGLPGSGKSTFGEQLVRSGRGWTRLCQDEMEGRNALEDALGRAAKDTTQRVIIDRTNVKRDDRKAFLSLAFNPKEAVCVHFDASAADCEERVAKRTDHPTIKYGGGRNAVRSMKDNFEPPTCEEGFAEVIVLQDFRDASHLLACWGAEAPTVAPMGYFKFPTTPHVLDLTNGRALTESDRLLDADEAKQFFDGRTVVIAEEKIDGANLGISLTENYEPRYQNRAHYVSSSYATQWKALDAWWDENGWAICQLLEPEVEILFGEWVWARHSVSYTRLPAYFVAFDIYNKRTGRFCSARERDRRLEGFNIPIVPRICERAFNGRGDLEQLLELQSAYSDGPLEGVYLRIDEPISQGGGLYLAKRGKVVRADFVQTIEDGGHWTHRKVERNSLDV